ncbi:MAG TPA: XdhC family protein [Acidimicrobiales bacterium]|nr:XdhC family protein [Acidimicrobiales bacterium]
MNPEIESRAAELREARVPFVHARVVRAERPTSAKPGDQAVVLPDGSIEGFVGGACAESTVRAQSLSLLDSGEPLLLRISPDEGEDGGAGAGDAPGTLSVVNHCLSGGTLEIFLEPVVPAPLLAVHGESPIAVALVALAGGVGFRAVEGGERALASDGDTAETPAAVVVASHGRGEEHVLEAAVHGGVPYVGLVASRKRGEAVLAGLDLDEAERASIHTPAGLDIGARTPHEVALSILAEIVSLRPRPSGAAPSSPPTADAASTEGAAGAEGATGDATAGAGPGPVALGERPAVATDLVCGMSVVTGDDALHLDHGGERYWFCGSGCLRAFAADPGAYVTDAESGPGPSDT